jgi:hypothetical protein
MNSGKQKGINNNEIGFAVSMDFSPNKEVGKKLPQRY